MVRALVKVGEGTRPVCTQGHHRPYMGYDSVTQCPVHSGAP